MNKPETLKMMQVFHTALHADTVRLLRADASYVDADRSIGEFIVSIGAINDLEADSHDLPQSVQADLKKLRKWAGNTISYFQITFC